MDDNDEKIVGCRLVWCYLHYFGIVRPVLNAAGVNPADSNTISTQAVVASNANPFSYSFQPFCK